MGQYDPQTEADRAAERCIVGSLQQKFPSLRIVGEEVSVILCFFVLFRCFSLFHKHIIIKYV